jgi:hypothetical protein
MFLRGRTMVVQRIVNPCMKVRFFPTQLLRRLVECLAHPIRKGLAVLFGRTFPRSAFCVIAADGVLFRESGASLGWATSPNPPSPAWHLVNVPHVPGVYTNYFDSAIRFHLISHCESRIVRVDQN